MRKGFEEMIGGYEKESERLVVLRLKHTFWPYDFIALVDRNSVDTNVVAPLDFHSEKIYMGYELMYCNPRRDMYICNISDRRANLDEINKTKMEEYEKFLLPEDYSEFINQVCMVEAHFKPEQEPKSQKIDLKNSGAS